MKIGILGTGDARTGQWGHAFKMLRK